MRIIDSVHESKLYFRICLLALFFLAAAASFNGYYDKWQFCEAHSNKFMPKLSLDAMLDGTASRPYVYRQLLPAIANGIDSLVPERTKDLQFHEFAPQAQLFDAGYLNSPLLQNRAYHLRYLIIYGMVFLFAWIATYAMYLVNKAAGVPPLIAILAAVVMILLMPYFLTAGGYYYDYPELAFMAIVVWMTFKVDWWWIVPVAALATWNKESFLFFVLTLYPLLRQRSSRIGAAVGCCVLALTCAAVYGWVWLHYRHNPGGTVEVHLVAQIAYLVTPSVQLLREKTYGIYFFSGLNIGWLGMIAWTARRGWSWLPKAIQRHAKIAAAINIPMYVVLCWPGELRDLSMLYITFVLLLAANLNIWAGGQINVPARQVAFHSTAEQANQA